MQGLNWDDLQFLLAVDRQGSFAAAARSLNVNESTVARRIASAEACLGTTLFDRSGGKLHPTVSGHTAIAKAERVELEVQALEREILGADERIAGSVRLTSVPIVVNRILVPALPPLLSQHPQLRIELVAEPRDLSLTKREADIALRLARPNKEVRAITRRIGQLHYAVYGSSKKRRHKLPWITYDDSLSGLPQQRWITQRLSQPHQIHARVIVNDAETLLQSLKAGLGKSLLPTLVGDKEPGLIRLDDGARDYVRELWMMVHPDLRDLRRIRVVLDWLEDTVS